MVESRQVDEPEPYLYDNDNERTDLFYSAGACKKKKKIRFKKTDEPP